MNEKTKCYCGKQINSAFIQKHYKTIAHKTFVENDILIQTIKNGNHKTKEKWFENFKMIGIDIPQYVLDYDFTKPINTTNYYEIKKDKLKEVVLCKCGKNIKLYSIPKHNKSKTHIKYMNSV